MASLERRKVRVEAELHVGDGEERAEAADGHAGLEGRGLLGREA